jgi:DNA end-binding protein Ku
VAIPVRIHEVRDFKQAPKCEKVNVSAKELELGIGLIDRLTTEEFNPENYQDDYRIRVLAMLDEKSKGKEVTISAPAPERGGKVVDIMEALKRSMERIRPRRNPPLLPQLRRKKEYLRTRCWS